MSLLLLLTSSGAPTDPTTFTYGPSAGQHTYTGTSVATYGGTSTWTFRGLPTGDEA